MLHPNDHIYINLIPEKNARDYPFWVIAASWDDTIISLLLFIIHPNYHIYINLIPEKIQGIPLFGP